MHARLWALTPWLVVAVVRAEPLQPAPGTEELVVSGFRPQTLQELDSSISLLDSKTIANSTLSSFEQVVQLVPNMNLSGEGSRARYFQLRGVGEREQYEGAPNPSVGFIVDDIDLSGIGGVAATYDVQQIEVLRGPQSARYGSSALAGMVFVQTANPGQDFSFDAELTGGTDDTLIAGAAVGGGLTDSLSGRLTVYQYQDNGFRNNTFLGRDDTNERDELTVRGKLDWAISDDWNALLTGFVADFDNGYDAFSLDNSDIVLSDEPGRDAQETWAGSLRVSGPLNDAVDLVSISTAARSDVDFGFDSDWVNDTTYLPDILYDYRYRNPRTRRTLSQELRLLSRPEGRLFGGSTDWVAGIYGQSLSENNAIDSTGLYIEPNPNPLFNCPGDAANPPNRPGVPEDPAAPDLPPFACIADRQIESRFESDTLAVFGGIDSRLSSTITVSAGLRFERWDAQYRDEWVDNGIFIGNPGVVNNAFDPDDTLVGGHLALSIDVNPDLRTYVRIAKGFKAGGFNPSLSALAAEQLEYSDEALWNFEVGLRGAALEGDLTFDLAFFSQRRDDAQLSQSNQFEPDDPNTFVFVTDNGEATAYGLEASGAWRLGDAWELSGSLGLLESGITEWNVRPGVVGRELAHAPAYTLNLSATWTGSDGYYARLDLVAVDEYYFDISHDQKSEPYEIVNLRIGKDWDHWGVAVWGRNIFDEDYATRGFFFGNEPPAFAEALYTRFGDPRQVGVTLSYRYQ